MEIVNTPRDELWKVVAESSFEDGAGIIEKALDEKWKGLKKTKVPFILGRDGASEHKEMVIRIPDKSLGNDNIIGIDEKSYELIIETSMGWRRTGKTIKTVLPKSKAS